MNSKIPVNTRAFNAYQNPQIQGSPIRFRSSTFCTSIISRNTSQKPKNTVMLFDNNIVLGDHIVVVIQQKWIIIFRIMKTTAAHVHSSRRRLILTKYKNHRVLRRRQIQHVIKWLIISSKAEHMKLDLIYLTYFSELEWDNRMT